MFDLLNFFFTPVFCCWVLLYLMFMVCPPPSVLFVLMLVWVCFELFFPVLRVLMLFVCVIFSFFMGGGGGDLF